MIRLTALILALLALPIAATAQSVYIPPVAAPAVTTTPVPSSYGVISTTAATVIKATPGTLFGGTSTGIQTNALTCFDNASAASGPIVLSSADALLGVGGAITGIPANGVKFTLGLTCQVPVAIVNTVNIWFF